MSEYKGDAILTLHVWLKPSESSDPPRAVTARMSAWRKRLPIWIRTSGTCCSRQDGEEWPSSAQRLGRASHHSCGMDVNTLVGYAAGVTRYSRLV